MPAVLAERVSRSLKGCAAEVEVAGVRGGWMLDV